MNTLIPQKGISNKTIVNDLYESILLKLDSGPKEGALLGRIEKWKHENIECVNNETNSGTFPHEYVIRILNSKDVPIEVSKFLIESDLIPLEFALFLAERNWLKILNYFSNIKGGNDGFKKN